ncbi:response regulator [Prosthecomicrobium sp. N25]|uniref:response regulator n=1 Tax=Prosthecomicrobium sp. N25 TaxID=3129254 RepID=UPI00307780E2
MTSLRVLICEDDPVQALLLEDLIYEAGHRPVGPARRFVDALEIVDGTPVDVAIVDLTLLDGRSGPLIARHLAERGIRVIVLSGLTEVDPDLAEIRHVFVAKPARPEVISRLLGRVAPPVAA